MSENTPNQSKAMQAIDVLLADKPSEFRAVVFELSRQLGWPDDEPGFLLAIATGQLEALIKQYPERITAAMQQAIEELKADWQQILEKLTLLATQNIDAAHQIKASLRDAQVLIDDGLSQTGQLFDNKQAAMMLALTDELELVQQVLADERVAMVRAAQQVTEHQKQVIDAHTSELITKAAFTWRERADSHVKQLIKRVRGQHYWEAVGFACLAAAILMSSSFMLGWMSRGAH